MAESSDTADLCIATGMHLKKEQIKITKKTWKKNVLNTCVYIESLQSHKHLSSSFPIEFFLLHVSASPLNNFLLFYALCFFFAQVDFKLNAHEDFWYVCHHGDRHLPLSNSFFLFSKVDQKKINQIKGILNKTIKTEYFIYTFEWLREGNGVIAAWSIKRTCVPLKGLPFSLILSSYQSINLLLWNSNRNLLFLITFSHCSIHEKYKNCRQCFTIIDSASFTSNSIRFGISYQVVKVKRIIKGK